MGTPAPRPLPARCPPGLVDEAETRLGFRLPDLLRRVLTEIADGGFGPGCGIVGIAGWAESGAHLVEQYEGFCEPVPDQPEADRPTAFVPLAHLGCGMYDCVDAATPGHPVVTYDALALDDGDSLTRP